MTKQPQDRIPEYIAWAERDRESANEDATAKELAIFIYRASRNIYFFADPDYQRGLLGNIRVVAEAQHEAATELSDENEAARYRVVAEMAQEFEDRVTPNQEVRIAPEQTRVAYDDLLTKKGDGIVEPEGPKTMHEQISKVLNLSEKLAGEMQDFHQPDANVAYVRGLYAKIGAAIEQVIDAYTPSIDIHHK